MDTYEGRCCIALASKRAGSPSTRFVEKRLFCELLSISVDVNEMNRYGTLNVLGRKPPGQHTSTDGVAAVCSFAG
jgi:hypothetical protein